MRFAAVAIDYDGTLATDGTVHPSTVAALEQVVASGRKFILVTGRMLRELLPLFPQAALCARIVAENGAVLYRPATRDQRLLTDGVSAPLVDVLRRKGVVPLDVGDSILATVRPHEVAVMEAIRDLGLEHHVIFNRESVMVLPPGVTKATGLAAALDELQLSAHEVVGIGDSENDHALFQASELAVAVASAVPTLRDAADWVTAKPNGAGTAEALLALVADDMAGHAKRLTRHRVSLGSSRSGEPITVSPVGENVLIAGTSGSGKSTLAHAMLEQLIDQGYQTCVVDPEGDYPSMEKMIVFGNPQRGPTVTEIMTALENPKAQVIVNLVGLPLEDRPPFFMQLLPKLQESRLRNGRPHRILVDEAHHLLPKSWRPTRENVRDLDSMLFVTVHPDRLATQLLDAIDVAVVLGHEPASTLRWIADREQGRMTTAPPAELMAGEALLWRKAQPHAQSRPAEPLRLAMPRVERQRHRRKYAEGELPPERSFYFRGPDGKLNLRAQNLIMFRQIADGVDDETWLHHLRQGDYSHWMETAIKDPSLAQIVQEVEGRRDLSAHDSRRRVADAIQERYTLPASGA
jgi:hydroxymethylpyrimidine pyrophosphatase-like HAD family hydrolase/energy-coupling factor transporter ATP-binding protein EcfA2